MQPPFRVGVTRDFLKPDGTLGFGDIGLGLLDEAPGVEWEFLAENTPELRRRAGARLRRAAGAGAAGHGRDAGGRDRLAVVARFGVGYDNVDVAACTRRGRAADDHARTACAGRSPRR